VNNMLTIQQKQRVADKVMRAIQALHHPELDEKITFSLVVHGEYANSLATIHENRVEKKALIKKGDELKK